MRISIVMLMLVLSGCAVSTSGNTSGNTSGCANKNLVCRYDLVDGGCEVVPAVCCVKPEGASCESGTPVDSSTAPSCVSVPQSAHREGCI